MSLWRWTVGAGAIVFALAWTGGSSLADPAPGRCGQVVKETGAVDSSVAQCMDELLDAQEDTIEELDLVVSQMRAMDLSAFGVRSYALRRAIAQDDIEEKLQFLRDEHARAREANGGVPEADHEGTFATADQDKGQDCWWSDEPFVASLEGEPPPGYQSVSDPRFGNDHCDVFDAIDLDGLPARVNERKENMCEKVCADRVNPNSNKPRKNERKDRVVGRLTDSIAATVRATGSLSDARRDLVRLQFKLSRSAARAPAAPADVCVSGFDLPAVFEIAATSASIANTAVSFVTAVLETAKDNVKPAANQTVAGFNFGSTVIPFALVAGISKMLEEVIAAVKDGLVLTGQIVSAFREDTLEVCMKSVHDDGVLIKNEFEGPDGAIYKLEQDVSSLKQSAGQTSAELETIRGQLVDLMAIVQANRELLLMPQGRREGFNH